MTTLHVTAIQPATEKQMAFLRDLIETRDVSVDEKASIEKMIADGISKPNASFVIGTLLKLNRVARAKAPATVTESVSLHDILGLVPKSRYALMTETLDMAGIEHNFNGDIAFFEVREYMGTRYMRRLIGAPGAFTRNKLTSDQVKSIVALIAANPLEATKRFGAHYTCCGCCGAELTDETSRSLQLGPECRKRFGL